MKITPSNPDGWNSSGAPSDRRSRWPPSARDNQSPAGDDDPTTILLADRVDAAEPRHRIAGVNLIDAAASFDQRTAIGDVAQYPTVDRGQTRYFRLRRWQRHWRGSGGRD